MKKMNSLLTLNQTELSLINGGTFAWDVGWLLGNTISGNFLNPITATEAMMDYWLHYNIS